MSESCVAVEDAKLEVGVKQQSVQSTPPPAIVPPREDHARNKDYILILLAILIKLGDGVEIYLPGVITQTVSCELGVSKVQEGILAVIFSLSYASTLLFSVFVLKILGERATLLLS